MDPLDRLRDLLGVTHANGDGDSFTALCPAHPDAKPSLAVSRGDAGNAVLHCFAGCATVDVLAALHLEWADLFAEPSTNGRGDGGVKRQIEATYDYTDEAGTLLSQKVRYFPKGFAQRRPDGKGGWVYNVKGVPQVLYNLPHVRRARAEGLPIYFVEGEKDCKALLDREECATTVPGGAGKWRASFTPEFRDAWVIVIADRDDAGRAHALTCARAISPVCRAIQVLESDRGKDAFDHFAAGGDFEDFRPVDWWPEPEPAEAVEPDAAQPTPATLSEIGTRRVKWLWPGWLPAGKLVLLDGDPGCGKSTVAVDLAARVSTGAPMPDQSEGREPAAVMFLNAEDGLADTLVPRAIAAGGDTKRMYALDKVAGLNAEGAPVIRQPELPTDLDVLERHLRQYGVRLLVVDVLFAYLAGYINSWRDQDVRRAMSPMADLAEATGCTMLLIRHLNKSGSGPAVYRGGGSIGLTGAARSVIAAAHDPRDETRARRVLALVKSNVASPPTALSYDLVGDPMWACSRVRWLGTSDITADELVTWKPAGNGGNQLDDAATWLQGLLADGPVPYQEVVSFGRHEGFDQRMLQRAAQRAGVIIRRVGSGRDHHSVWELLPPEERP